MASYSDDGADVLSITEVATVTGELVAAGADTLTIMEVAKGGFLLTASASDTLTIKELQIDPDSFQPVEVDIGLRDEATATLINPIIVEASDTLNITESASLVPSTWVASASDTLNIREAILQTLSTVDLCGYDSSQVGSYPGTTGQGGFRLQFPHTGTVTDEVVVRNPNLGNKHRIAPHRIVRQSRGGEMLVYRDSVWPTVETLLVQFSYLSRAQANEVQNFMNDNLGQKIKLIDQEDRAWIGFISQPQDPVVQDGRDVCTFTVSFEFQGALA